MLKYGCMAPLPMRVAPFLFVLMILPWAQAGSVDDPEIEDPGNDAGSRPGMDVTAAWINVDDPLADDHDLDLETGQGWLDLRELALPAVAYELAAYAYRGDWRSPAGADPSTGLATFPPLSVYGASLRGPLLGGLISAELGYYDSRADRKGTDPTVRNSELRLLLAHERELAQDLSLGVQLYLEWVQKHDAQARTLPPGAKPARELHPVATVRLTWRTLRQNLTLSLFSFYAPLDQDVWIRRRIRYALTDHWSAELGANILFGRDPNTFFAQFAKNTNAYAAIRYGF